MYIALIVAERLTAERTRRVTTIGFQLQFGTDTVLYSLELTFFFSGGGGGRGESIPCKARALLWKIRVASSLNIKICKCWSQMKQRLCPIKFKWVKIQRWYLSRSKVKIELSFVDNWCNINPLTAGVAYIGFFTQLLPHSVPPFKHVKAIMWHQSWRFEKSWPAFCRIWIIFTHLKLWIASARHNFKWVKIQIEYSGG